MTLVRTASLLVVTLGLVVACSDDTTDVGGGGGSGSGGQAGGVASAGSGAGRSPTAGQGPGGTSSAGSAGTSGATAAGAGGTSAGSGGAAAGGAVGEAGAGGSDPNPDLIATCLDAEVIDDTRTEALTLQGDGLDLAIVRRVDPDGFSTSGTTVWLAQRFGIVKGSLAKCVTTPADLTYTISHHNFDDKMTAKVDGQTLLVTLTRTDYSAPAAWTVTAQQGDATSWGPLPLVLVGCTRLDSGENCLPSYQ
jgi:hypothetical protein